MIARTSQTAAVSNRRPIIEPNELTPRERRWLETRWTRPLLVIAALVLVVQAVPVYIRADDLTAQAHAARHLASWQVGFGVGLFVAAWMSRLSHAMLALAATFAALTVTAAAIEVIAGHRGPRAASVHTVELVGVFLLWRLTPPHLLPWTRRGAKRPDADLHQVSPQPLLRLIARELDGKPDPK